METSELEDEDVIDGVCLKGREGDGDRDDSDRGGCVTGANNQYSSAVDHDSFLLGVAGDISVAAIGH